MTLTLRNLRDRCDVDAATGCWLWKQARTSYGYPVVSHLGRTVYVRRLVVALARRAPAKAQRVVCTCGDVGCVAPDHLVVMGPAAFSAFQVRRGSTRPSAARSQSAVRARARDQRNKLDPDKVVAIMARLAAGESQAAVARDYGVTRGAISNITRGRAWRSVRLAAWVPA